MLGWLPNLLTGARLVAVVPFVVLLAGADNGQSTAAAVIFIAASVTDYLDGYLARHTHHITRFGQIVDPLADRLLIDLCVILLVYEARLAWWLAAPLLLRDAWLALVFERRHVATDIKVTMTGKVATALIMVSLALMMLTPSRGPEVMFAFGLATSLVAGVQYMTRAQGGLTSKPS
ncbi:MAG: CDP-alcohol phosphatidyltransferase family protein [Gaiellales bacterium]